MQLHLGQWSHIPETALVLTAWQFATTLVLKVERDQAFSATLSRSAELTTKPVEGWQGNTIAPSFDKHFDEPLGKSFDWLSLRRGSAPNSSNQREGATMVKELHKGDSTFYICGACGFAYKEKEWAEKCQEWCEEHQSCNLEITEHAVPLD